MKKHLRITWNAPVVLEHSGCEFCCHVIKLPHGWKRRDASIYDIPFFPPVTDDVDPDVYTYIWTCGLVTSNR